MARIAGIDLPKNKRIEIALTYIYGIGRTTSQKILDRANVDRDTKSDLLTEEEINAIRQVIDSDHNTCLFYLPERTIHYCTKSSHRW